MKFRELMALLERFDPDDTVLINRGSQCFLLVNHRPGMSEPFYEGADGFHLRELDQNFLRNMQIRF
jgi:hypothetical protein